MGERSGVGLVEIALLEAVSVLGARPDRRYVKSSRVLEAVEARIGLAPGYGYQVLVDLALPWATPVPLVTPQGNFGSRGDDPPANARYTEVRLSPGGQVALASEHGELAPVPIGLINGNTHRDGTRPPFHPQRVIDAIRLAISEPQATDRELEDAVGKPEFMTGCTITGDLAALYAGQTSVLRLEARVRITDAVAIGAELPHFRGHGGWLSRPFLLIDNFPPYISVDGTIMSIANRAQRRDPDGRYPDLHDASRLQLSDVRDESSRGGYWAVCLPDNEANPENVRRQLMNVYGVFSEVTVALPKPLATMIRDWVAAHKDEDIADSLARLAGACAADSPND